MEQRTNSSDTEAGVDLCQLPPFTTLVVRTRNSSYQIVVIEGSICVRGGAFFPEPTSGYLDGAGNGAGPRRAAWIAVGMSMEVRADGRCVVTSRARSITTEPPGIPTVQENSLAIHIGVVQVAQRRSETWVTQRRSVARPVLAHRA